jgi:hypothetical protein
MMLTSTYGMDGVMMKKLTVITAVRVVMLLFAH